MKTGASPRRLKHAISAQTSRAASHARRGRDLALLAQLESDALKSMANVDKGVGEKLIDAAERRCGRIVEQPPEIADESLDARPLCERNVAEAVGEVDHAEARMAGYVAQHQSDQVAHQGIRALALEALE